jgi:anti-sigma regulatory factor (Ser/Thr protein kinase)
MLTEVVTRRESDGREAKPVRATATRSGELAFTTARDRPSSGVQIASCVVSSVPQVVRELRVATVERLRGWGVGSNSGLVDLLELAVSELATNAIRHGPGSCGAQVAVTWGLYRGGPGPDRVSVSVLDGGRGGLRIRDSRSDDLFEGQYGLPLLLRCGLRIEPTSLPAHEGHGGHLVTAWTPVRARTRARVCACPCWAHGYQAARCQGLISGTRHSVALFDGSLIACCAPCAAALSGPTDAAASLLDDSALLSGTSAKGLWPTHSGAAARGERGDVAQGHGRGQVGVGSGGP